MEITKKDLQNACYRVSKHITWIISSIHEINDYFGEYPLIKDKKNYTVAYLSKNRGSEIRISQKESDHLILEIKVQFINYKGPNTSLKKMNKTQLQEVLNVLTEWRKAMTRNLLVNFKKYTNINGGKNVS